MQKAIDTVVGSAIAAAEAGWIPELGLRLGIRQLCRWREQSLEESPEAAAEAVEAFRARQGSGPIAPVPELANQQHYEQPAEFFEAVLGPHRKYSCCYFDNPRVTLADAEAEALLRTEQHADLADGQRILDLGCGWGAFSLWAAGRFPRARIVGVSNSASQRESIMMRARASGLGNLEIVTADMNRFEPEGRFDRVVSVEMFEHMRNHGELLRRIRSWLQPSGRLLIHVFCARQQPYAYLDGGADDWMARNFFSGGIMPSDDLLLRWQEDLVVERQWRWSGVHYQRTADAWLANLARNRRELEAVLAGAGEHEPKKALQRWRLFFLGCSELFGYRGGRNWWVSHYRFKGR